MELKDLKQDKRNYRKHNDRNLSLIKKSVDECGFGRSIVIDAEDNIIGGNGLVSTLDKNTPVRVVETDGSELVVVKRTDLETESLKRKRLAVLDNSTSDTSKFNYELLREDLQISDLEDFGISMLENFYGGNGVFGEQAFTEKEVEAIGEDIAQEYITPERMQEIREEHPDLNNRVIICFKPEQKPEIEGILGIKIEKVLYNINEIMGE